MSKPDARITAASLVTLAVAMLAVTAVAGRGWNEESLRFLVRITARLSVALFLVAFVWDDAVSVALSRPIRRPAPNRVHFFVGFAVSHLFHLGTLVALAIWFPEPFLSDVNLITLIGGGLAYAFIFGIAIWYCTRTTREPDPILVTAGSIYIWGVFARAYGFRVSEGSGYAMIFTLLVIAIAIYGIAFYRYRNPKTKT